MCPFNTLAAADEDSRHLSLRPSRQRENSRPCIRKLLGVEKRLARRLARARSDGITRRSIFYRKSKLELQCSVVSGVNNPFNSHNFCWKQSQHRRALAPTCGARAIIRDGLFRGRCGPPRGCFIVASLAWMYHWTSTFMLSAWEVNCSIASPSHHFPNPKYYDKKA